THPRRRPAGHLANRVGQREHVPLLDVASNDAREVAEASRMREPGFVRHTDLCDGTGVAADARPWKAERRFDVGLTHHVIDGHHTSAALRDEVPRDVRGLALHLTSKLTDA